MKILQQTIALFNPSSLNEREIGQLVEQIGRVCWKSEDRITPTSYQPFVRMLISKGHESVLEHVSITILAITARSITHEIVRHRIGAYTQESTRYVSYEKGINFIQPPLAISELNIWQSAMESAEYSYQELSKLTSPQLAREILPQSTASQIYITYNLRQWRHFLKIRTDKAAHPQMQELANSILNKFKILLPIFFEDIKND